MKCVATLMTALLLLSCTAKAQPSGGNLAAVSLNRDWQFCKGDSSVFAAPAFDDSDWRVLDLPHDWGVEGPFVQAYPGETGKLEWWGTAWYRRHLQFPLREFSGREGFLVRDIKDARYWLDFDGVMSGSAVYVNGHPVGGRPYGYSSFRVEIGQYLVQGDNVIAVRVDNKPNSSRWYPGGGIYRDVRLVATAASGVVCNGTFVSTDTIGASGVASVRVRTWICGQGRLEITSSIPLKGAPIFGTAPETLENKVAIVATGDTTCVEQRFAIPRAKLWSPESPECYVLETAVRNLETGETDRYYTSFGIRQAQWRPDGFYLNGEKYFIKGVCLHHDGGALGAVWNPDLWQRRLQQLKDLGCNAIRSAHNPPAPGLLELCDRMGFLVIDELTDTWTIAKKPNGYASLFDEWAEKDLVDMIWRDRNHPSVVLWSIGNECAEQGYIDKWDIPRRLTEICHREDPTRQTTSGNDNVWGAFQPYHETVDVFGFNYKPHYYAQFHEAFPNQPYYGSETASCISTRGYYRFPVSDDKEKGWPDGAPYQVSAYSLYAPYWASSPDFEWFHEDQNPSFCGEFVWSGFDYLGEPTPYNFDPTVLTNFHDEAARLAAEKDLEEMSRNAPPSRSSYFGIFDLAGFPKDIYWLYQSRWRPDLPMAHILPHWNWHGREGETTPVHVFTSGDSGELFVNGVSQGVRTKAEGQYRLRWDDVVYEPGTVSVVTTKDGRPWACDTVETSGPAAAMRIDAQVIGRTIFLTVSMQDASGRLVPDACNRLSFKVEGPARLAATDAGDPTSHIPFYSDTLPAFAGLCSAIVLRDVPRRTELHKKPKPAVPAPVRITVTSPGFPAASVVL